MPALTVVTTTYDRAHTLPRVWDSLRHQSFRDFEWVVVDDGSTDGTAPLLERWAASGEFPVRVRFSEHAGRHVAANQAAQDARGELLVNLDSDDECTPDALERIWTLWTSVPEDRRSEYAGVVFRCRDQFGQLQARPLPEPPVADPTRAELHFRFRAKGEYFSAIRTDLRRRHPYPELAEVRHVPEGVVMIPLDPWRMRCSNEVLRVYWRDDHPSRLTNHPATRHAAGHRLWHQAILEHRLRWFCHEPSLFIRSAINLARFARLSGVRLVDQFAELRSRRSRLLFMLFAPAGVLLARADGRRGRSRRLRPGATT